MTVSKRKSNNMSPGFLGVEESRLKRDREEESVSWGWHCSSAGDAE